MFKTEDIIGDIVFISFIGESPFSDIGIANNAGHFLVKGFDHLGLWLQHPGLIINNADIKTISSEKKIDALFLVMWNEINTIMHYPNRDGFDFPSEFNKDVGFIKKG